MTQRARAPAELYAAAVNGLMVLILPLVSALAIWLVAPDPGNRVTAYVSPLWHRIAQWAVGIALFITSAAPFAIVAAWRTWVHDAY